LDIVAPALPASNTRTTLVLLQNGLNIEKPFLTSHPTTPILSGVSLIGSAQPTPGKIVQDGPDTLYIGAFEHPKLGKEVGEAKAKEFVRLYGEGGKTDVQFRHDVLYDRWRKLVYNACLNPICAVTGLDTGRIRLADGALEGLVRPAMREIVAAARGVGVKLEDDVVNFMIDVDPIDAYLEPSMLADVKRVRPPFLTVTSYSKNPVSC
jgi:2-dehydropantoate 2-reductase